MVLTSELEGQLVLHFQGRLDTARCDEMANDVRATLAEPNRPVVFDLDGVEFVSSAFLRLCVYAWHRTGAHGFQIVNVDPFVKRVFKIAALDNMLM